MSAYRIIEEALLNVIRHAHATRVVVRLRAHDDGRLCVEVEDNGMGFDTTTRSLGTGIIDMRERALADGGTLVLDSSPGHGCRVRLSLPLLRPPPKATDELRG